MARQQLTPTVLGSLTMVSGSVVASGLHHGATVDVTSGSITLAESSAGAA